MIRLLSQLTTAWAERQPLADAVVFKEDRLSYGTLEQRANALANTLIELGVQRRDRVGICMDKCLETPVAMHGILKAGAAYVPLDPAAPVDRLAHVLADCDIGCAVVSPNRRGKLMEAGHGTRLGHLIGIEEDGAHPQKGPKAVPWREVALRSVSAPGVKILEADLAYVIYTSGSTGMPKGIMHTHGSGLSFARWAVSEYGLVSDDRIANHSPLHFDISIFDYFASSLSGAAVVIVPEPYLKLPASYSELLERHRVSVLFTVPFALIQLLLRGMLEARDLGALRWVIFGGEPFPVKHLGALMKALPQATFDNMYGPAEVNGCTHHTLDPRDLGDGVPIGRLADIAEGLVVDGNDQPVLAGEVGELLVRTPTMMQGYWRRPDLNARAFHHREVCSGLADVYYRTGDLVRDVGEGVLMFVGRKDRQVKVRGYRVELDEVEAALAAHKDVAEAAAFVVADGSGSQAIHAAVTLRNGSVKDDPKLASEHLGAVRRRLPAYAVPLSLEIRDDFPRTTSGKIDRRALAENWPRPLPSNAPR